MHAISIQAERTRAYGTWAAVALLADGRTVTGYGLSEQQARRNASRRVPCDTPGCPGSLHEGEDAISRRAYHGRALCATCRERANGGPNPAETDEDRGDD